MIQPWLLLAAALAAGQGPVLRIASDATFPPFHFIDGASAPTGFDIELARLVAQRAGFQPLVVVRPYDDLLSGLDAGAHDLVAATTGVTPEREKLYLFTRPYFETCQAALVRVGPNEPGTTAELKGRRVGAAGSGTSARALRGIAGARQLLLGKGQAGVPSLEGGVIDALIVDEFGAVATPALRRADSASSPSRWHPSSMPSSFRGAETISSSGSTARSRSWSERAVSARFGSDSVWSGTRPGRSRR